MKRPIAMLVIGSFLAATRIDVAEAGQLEDGVEAYHNRDFKTAFRLLQPLAEKGVVVAQIELGFMYRYGSGVPKDFELAAKWWRKAADQGNAYAQSQLRGMSFDGEAPAPAPKPVHASRVGKSSSPVGPIDHTPVGSIYANGQPAPLNDAQAAAWYRNEAGRGDVTAQLKLAEVYASGKGLPRDDAEALLWFRKAAEQGNSEAQFQVAERLRTGQGAPKDEAQALGWLHKAAEQGSPNAEASLGRMYLMGQGAPQDDAIAISWFRKAADAGNAAAQFNLALMLKDGRGAPKDLVELRRVAAQIGRPRECRRPEPTRRDVLRGARDAAGLRPGRRLVQQGR